MKSIISILGFCVCAAPGTLAQEVLTLSADYSVATLPDVSGNGIPDYVTGSYNSGSIRSGADGAILRDFGTLVPLYFTCGTEVSCAAIGDIDNDGIEDVALSTRTGVKIWQVEGVNSFSEFGRRMVAIGDTTGDGLPELAIATDDVIQIRSGITGGLIHTIPAQFDPEMSAIGDVTGDGIPDLIVGINPSIQAQFGMTKIYAGSSWVEVLSLTGSAIGDAFGTCVASAGDADLDGLTDILVGSPGSDLGGNNAGAVFIVSSTTGAVLGRVHGWWPGDWLGYSCASPGDIDLDGLPEVAAGSSNLGLPHAQGYVMLCSSTAGNSKHLFLPGNEPEFFGSRLTALGDLNMDGKPDLAVAVGDGLVFINFVPGVSTYGLGTPECKGGNVMDVNKKPSIGTLDFEIRGSHAPNGSVGALLVSDVPDVLGSDLFGIGVLLHTGVEGATVFDAYDLSILGNGRANVAIPIPNDPQLVGARFYVQGLLHWAGGVPCIPSPLGLSSSAGLAVVVQP